MNFKLPTLALVLHQLTLDHCKLTNARLDPTQKKIYFYSPFTEDQLVLTIHRAANKSSKAQRERNKAKTLARKTLTSFYWTEYDELRQLGLNYDNAIKELTHRHNAHWLKLYKAQLRAIRNPLTQ